MIDQYGPHVQMGTLAEQMAARYQKDTNLELESHLALYMEEVEVNIKADSFDHIGFMNKISGRLTTTLAGTIDPRRRDFLQAVLIALQDRVDRHPFDVAVGNT